MTRSNDPKALFLDAVRELAIARSLEPAARGKAGLVLELSRSQLARDGLFIAASQFACSIEGQPAVDVALEDHVRTAANRAPINTWWRSRIAASPPGELARGDIWVSAEEIQRLASRCPPPIRSNQPS